MKRSTQEINNAIAQLEKNLATCEVYNCFGDDNRLLIAVMIDVIKMNRSKHWIDSNNLSLNERTQEYPDNCLWRAAMDAREWLDGKFDLDELFFPERQIMLRPSFMIRDTGVSAFN